MSIIKLPLRFEGPENEKVIYTLFDSGANLSCIHPDQVEDLTTTIALHEPRMIATAGENHFIKVTHRATLDFYLNDVLLSDEFLVVPGLSEDAVIGAATMQKWKIKLDFDTEKVTVDPKVAKRQLI
jgi:predicted aspartyl protease